MIEEIFDDVISKNIHLDKDEDDEEWMIDPQSLPEKNQNAMVQEMVDPQDLLKENDMDNDLHDDAMLDDNLQDDYELVLSEGAKSWSNKDIVVRELDVDMMALQSELGTTKCENESLRRRN